MAWPCSQGQSLVLAAISHDGGSRVGLKRRPGRAGRPIWVARGFSPVWSTHPGPACCDWCAITTSSSPLKRLTLVRKSPQETRRPASADNASQRQKPKSKYVLLIAARVTNRRIAFARRGSGFKCPPGRYRPTSNHGICDRGIDLRPHTTPGVDLG